MTESDKELLARIDERLQRIEIFQGAVQKEVMDIYEVAAFLRLTPNRVRMKACKREIPHYKGADGKLYFKRTDIESWQCTTRIPTKEELITEAATRGTLRGRSGVRSR